jgi:hypothetical protein
MQIGKGQVPLRLNFDPLSSGVRRPSAQAELNRALKTAANPAAFKAQANQVTQAARIDIRNGSRVELYNQITDKLGQIRSSLSLGPLAQKDEATETTSLSLSGVDSLQKLGQAIGDTISFLEAASKHEGKNDALREDLQAALTGLFSKGNGETRQGLGDVGVSLDNGEAVVDTEALQALSAAQLEQADTFLGSFIGERVRPLLNASERALDDEQKNAPLDQRLAQKAVSVQADISRLQQRQQVLLFSQVTLESLAADLKDQDAKLRDTQDKLNKRDKLGEPEEKEFPPDLLDPDTRREEINPAPTPAPLAQPTAPAQGPAPVPVAAGLASFGLSS